MIDNEEHLNKILKVLNSEGILKDLILVGSWCLLFYKEIFENFVPFVRTTDIDFYVPKTKQVKESNCVINSLKKENYDLSHDTLTDKTTFISPDGFEIEFLTKLTRKNTPCVQLGKTNIYAESISHVDIFTNNYIEVVYKGLTLKIVSPSAYVLQKLVINNKREGKSEKDIQSIEHVLNYIKVSKKSKIELNELFLSLPKKWQETITKTCEEKEINLFG
jgi:hypothetical protein